MDGPCATFHHNDLRRSYRQRRTGHRCEDVELKEISMPQVDDKTSVKIDLLAMEGNVLLEDDNDPQAAIEKWRDALGLLPSPERANQESLWLYASIGEAWRQLRNIDEAQIAFEIAYKCPDGHLNPLVLLRLGEGLMHQQNHERASQYLLQAYMLEGTEIFEDSPQAFKCLKEHQNI